MPLVNAGRPFSFTSHEELGGALLVPSCHVVFRIICQRAVINKHDSLVSFVFKDVSVSNRREAGFVTWIFFTLLADLACHLLILENQG